MIFIRANSFINANRGADDIERIVMHTTEGGPERSDFAEDIASFFAAPSTSVSAHYVVDNNSVVQCVKETDVAFHALGDNDQSIGIELAGKAGQSREQWEDDYSRAQLELAAQLVADICKRRSIPPKRLTNEQLRDRRRGIVSHKQVSDEFGEGIRSDPGPNFPWSKFLNRVEAILADQVQFFLVNSNDEDVFQSSPVDDEAEARRQRLGAFLGSLTEGERLEKVDRELAQNNRVKIVSRDVT